MRADIGDGPQIRRATGLDSPVVILRIEQPILDIRPRDRKQSAEITARDALADFAADG